MNRMRPEYIGVFIAFIILVYMIINVIFFSNKGLVSIYEVQAEEITSSSTYKGIALRNEEIITSANSGYINYYVQNGKRAAKNCEIYSIDEGSRNFNGITNGRGVDKLADNDIKAVKNVVYGYLDAYSDFKINSVHEFKQEFSDTIYSLVNDNSIENMKDIASEEYASAFHVKKADRAGVISYKTDSFCGYSFDNITAEMFTDNYKLDVQNLKSTGLISAGNPICRIVTDDSWQIAVKIPEELYIRLLEMNTVSIYINDYYLPVSGDLKTVQQGSDFYALISLDKYMSTYIDERYLRVEFDVDDELGLKIPVSSKIDKEFYTIPLSMFVKNENYKGEVLLREAFDAEGNTVYEAIYPTKYFTDGAFAYIDIDSLNEGDILENNKTGERLRVSSKAIIEGVFNVNKGYHQFVRIEKIKASGEYIIIKKNTPNGIRLYDHIALNANEASDQTIIY
ncbi:MAG: hypothetical protein MJ131_08850 [Lachnospiraceae bacterium]|nr:hypothetical protein [Lachnospiraceae bacterium]